MYFRRLCAALTCLAVILPGAALAAGAASALMMIQTRAPDTPDGQGLLATVYGEARNVERHARYAASKTDDLDWMRTQARHVIHAIEPEASFSGRGLGYGLKKALAGLSLAAGRAAGATDATEGVKMHAAHVAAAASDSMARADAIRGLANSIILAADPQVAAPLVREMRDLSLQLLAGVDLDRDGKIAWTGGEGGVDQIAAHVQLMADALAQ
ncbi:MAG: hypothetical protein RIC36_10935 [Rhodospirillales bacterium]